MHETINPVDHIPLVKYVASKLRIKPDFMDDATQCGCIGLIRAIKKYNPAKGKFSTFAFLCIKHEIYQAMIKESKVMRRTGAGTGTGGWYIVDLPIDMPPIDISSLDDRSRKILVMRYKDDMTLHDIGLQLSLSRERVRQILVEIHKILRQQLGREESYF